MKRFSLMLLLAVVAISAFAQNTERKTPLTYKPETWDNQNFAICYGNGEEVYNLRSIPYCSPGKVLSVKISPAAFSFAVMYEKGKKTEIGIYSVIDGERFHTFRTEDDAAIVNFCFTADARCLVVLKSDQRIIVYSLKDYKQVRSIELKTMPTCMAMSSNNFFLALVNGKNVLTLNYEKGTQRTGFQAEADVNDVAFSADNSRMAILSADGVMKVYDTRNFEVQYTVSNLGEAKNCCFHPEGKYIFVTTASNHIAIVNLKDIDNPQSIKAPGSGISRLGYAKSLQAMPYLVYNTAGQIVFHQLDYLVPDYQKIVRERADELMDVWVKQKPGESREQYTERVSDQSRAQQRCAYENQISTELAGDKVASSVATLGNYDTKTNLLEIRFNNMASIYIGVAQAELAGFGTAKDITFSKCVYAVNEKDNFDLVYTEVHNSKNGKDYIFDNQCGNKVEFIASQEDYVPIEIIQQSSADEQKLEDIKEEIVAQAMDSNLISNHTHINVKTDVEATTDADGKKIMNYSIDFNYYVDQEFSMTDDYKAGHYLCAESEAAMAMLRLVKKALTTHFVSYIVTGRKVLVQVYGSSDATPVNRTIPYKSEYGDFTNELIYNKGELSAMTVTRATGITSNEQLSFVRAAGVKDYLVHNLTELQQMMIDYTFHISVSEEKGSEYRRIGVKFTFIDAFQK